MRRGLEGSTSSGAIMTGVGDPILSKPTLLKPPSVLVILSHLIPIPLILVLRDFALSMPTANGN